jgi:hypothetical protein
MGAEGTVKAERRLIFTAGFPSRRGADGFSS